LAFLYKLKRFIYIAYYIIISPLCKRYLFNFFEF